MTNIIKPNFPPYIQEDTDDIHWPFLASAGLTPATMERSCIKTAEVVSLSDLNNNLINVEYEGETYEDIPVWTHTDIGTFVRREDSEEADDAISYFEGAASQFAFCENTKIQMWDSYYSRWSDILYAVKPEVYIIVYNSMGDVPDGEQLVIAAIGIKQHRFETEGPWPTYKLYIMIKHTLSYEYNTENNIIKVIIWDAIDGEIAKIPDPTFTKMVDADWSSTVIGYDHFFEASGDFPGVSKLYDENNHSIGDIDVTFDWSGFPQFGNDWYQDGQFYAENVYRKTGPTEEIETGISFVGTYVYKASTYSVPYYQHFGISECELIDSYLSLIMLPSSYPEGDLSDGWSRIIDIEMNHSKWMMIFPSLPSTLTGPEEHEKYLWGNKQIIIDMGDDIYHTINFDQKVTANGNDWYNGNDGSYGSDITMIHTITINDEVYEMTYISDIYIQPDYPSLETGIVSGFTDFGRGYSTKGDLPFGSQMTSLWHFTDPEEGSGFKPSNNLVLNIVGAVYLLGFYKSTWIYDGSSVEYENTGQMRGYLPIETETQWHIIPYSYPIHELEPASPYDFPDIRETLAASTEHFLTNLADAPPYTDMEGVKTFVDFLIVPYDFRTQDLPYDPDYTGP